MNKLILFIALMIFQSWTLVGAASYQIQLKNGNEIKTSHYWEEGDEIKFYAYGGVAGVQKGLVSSVTTSNVPYKEDSSFKENLEKSRDPSVVSDPKSKESAQTRTGETAVRTDISGGKSGEKSEAIDFDSYREKKAVLKEKLDDALQRNREATAIQNQEAKESTRKEYLDFSKQIIALGDELKGKNKGVLPDWWND